MKFFRRLIISLLRALAQGVLARYRPLVVSVSGSVGKTSTRLATVAAMSPRGFVGQPTGNYNTEIGLPLAILRSETGYRSLAMWLAILRRSVMLLARKQEYPDILVLELGSDKQGDAEPLVRLIKPKVAIVTAVSETHLAGLGDLDGVAVEEGVAVGSLPPDGWAILNRDDERVWAMRAWTAAPVKSYGWHAEADVRIESCQITEHGRELGMLIKIAVGGSSTPVFVAGGIGQQYAMVYAAAVAGGVALGMNVVDISRGLEDFVPAPGRMRALPGQGGSLLIDDTYNSSPLACRVALDALAEVRSSGLAKRTIAAMGDMLELGVSGPALHKEIGRYALGKADIFVAVGELAAHMATAATAAGLEHVKAFATTAEAANYLRPIVGANDVVLIKGSQGSRMEKVTVQLLAHPHRAGELLARQSYRWGK